MTSDLIDRLPDLDLGEDSPVMKVIEVCAYREKKLRERINYAAKQTMLAYATGTNLDGLATNYLVNRLEDESDDDFRERIAESLDGYAAAGHEAAYRYLAKSVSSHVLDAKTVKTLPGTLVVYVLADGTDGIIEDVEQVILADDAKQLCSSISVMPAVPVEFGVSISLTLFSGPASAPIIAAAKAEITSLIEENIKLGASISSTAIEAAAHVDGVYRAVLSTPSADIVCSEIQYPLLTSLNVTIEEDRQW